MPDRGRQRAAGDALHRRGIIVADPHRRDVVRGEADEPGVVIILRRSGLAGGFVSCDSGAAAGAFLYDAIEHRDEIAVDMACDDALRLRLLALVENAARGIDLVDEIGIDAIAARGERAVRRRQLEW